MKTLSGGLAGCGAREPAPGARFIGLDIGAETIKAAELVRTGSGLAWSRRAIVEHQKDPERHLSGLLGEWNWNGVAGAAVTGRFSRHVHLPSVPAKQAQSRGVRFCLGDEPVTVVAIGSHGFSVLERRANGTEVFRGNSRCSQGTGNFLRQLIERFGLSVAEAGVMCADVDAPAPLSGRCPVILKTDMTHLANKGEDRIRILAGLFDAVCENVITLMRPGTTPPRVVLAGGVSRSPRVRKAFERLLSKAGMCLQALPGDDVLFLDALGCAILAAERPAGVPPASALTVAPEKMRLERLPALRDSLAMVKRMPAVPPISLNGHRRLLALGFDIGSTGSKAVALDLETCQVLWEGYRRTSGAPVEAAQALLREFISAPAGRYPVLSMGVTGSGREIVGSLMATCYGKDGVNIINEIAAHAEGALHYDPAVDTIFEIGGQDAKYIRLADGRIVDCAMNEACSAGTGSFIEEQGRRFAGMQDVAALNRRAMAAPYGVSLGQHCSVFMAEIIEEATTAGIEQDAIMAGLYDAVVQNYLHRVKGSRSVGRVIFCQGMPFAADALAAAVARQTGGRVIVPPNPGTVGALGIALITRREVAWQDRAALDLGRFLDAAIEKKETFVCASNKGCGGAGNRCRVDCIKTVVEGRRQSYTWGGGCSMYDKGTRRRKLPDRAPDPFKERQALCAAVAASCAPRGNRRRVAVTDEFALNGLFPFFAKYLYELGLDLAVVGGAEQSDLKRGIQSAGVPLCAPMQLYHGIVHRMTEQKPDVVFLPRIREMSRVDRETNSVTCPMVQASPDLVASGLKSACDSHRAGAAAREGEAAQCGDCRARNASGAGAAPVAVRDRSGDGSLTHVAGVRLAAPVIDLGQGRLDSREFMRSCRDVADSVGAGRRAWRRAFAKARETQLQFEAGCEAAGRRALEFCAANGIAPVVVLGRSYTIYSSVLNSNVPPILREQGAIAIPVDCYPVGSDLPVFPEVYWGYGQRILRAAHQIRRTPGVYSLYCSNYSCGPDSFTLHFYSYVMDGRPFAIIETDGHSGDAGTKTRVEAFLHCVAQDMKSSAAGAACREFGDVAGEQLSLDDVRAQNLRMLIPSMGPSARVLDACFRGLGVQAEILPAPERHTLQVGRRYTSGKECVPTCLTLGGLLERLEREKNTTNRFAFLMPKADGPCRLGVYHILHRIVLEQLGWRKRVRIWSPCSTDYFAGTPSGIPALVMAGIAGMDLLVQALHDVRPVEREPGRADAIHGRYVRELLALIEKWAGRNVTAAAAVREVVGGAIFGVRHLIRRAAAEFADARGPGDCPTVLLTGEIYVRCEPFANDFTAEKLEKRGIRVRLTPASEWLDYVRHLADVKSLFGPMRLQSVVQRHVHGRLYRAMARPLGWAPLLRAEETVRIGSSYVSGALRGEAVLTVGGAVAEWRHGHIDGVVSVGPLECMPNKISEAQFARAAEEEGLISTTLSLNGDPLESETLDNFVFEVKSHFEKRRGVAPACAPAAGAFRRASEVRRPAAGVPIDDLVPEQVG